MTDTGPLVLRQLLITGYDELKAKLTRRLGSADAAADAVQDTWLRLQRANIVGRIDNPARYLFRIALNVARDRKVAERHHLAVDALDAAIEFPDQAADPAAIHEARSELELAKTLIRELPERQRSILLAARLDGLPRREIARRLGISVSLVEKELRQAHEYCLARRAYLRRPKIDER